MGTAFYLPRSVRTERSVHPCTPRSFQSLKVTKRAEFVKQTCSWAQCSGSIEIDRKRLKGALLLFLGFSTQALSAGLSSHADLIVKDSGATPRDGVRVTYLGTNGYQFEFKGHALLVDPYFSRVNRLNVVLGSRIQPDISRVAEGMRHLAPKPDAILVTHGHFDHLLDVPILMSKTQARLIASASAVDLAKRAGASFGEAVTAGDVRGIGPWKIRVLPATHDRLFGKVPFDQHEMRGFGPPQRAPHLDLR